VPNQVGFGEYLLLSHAPLFKRRYTVDGDVVLGCTHGCLFCYVWRLHSANKLSPYHGAELGEWSKYFYVKQESFSYIGSVSS